MAWMSSKSILLHCKQTPKAFRTTICIYSNPIIRNRLVGTARRIGGGAKFPLPDNQRRIVLARPRVDAHNLSDSRVPGEGRIFPAHPRVVPGVPPVPAGLLVGAGE